MLLNQRIYEFYILYIKGDVNVYGQLCTNNIYTIMVQIIADKYI